MAYKETNTEPAPQDNTVPTEETRTQPTKLTKEHEIKSSDLDLTIITSSTKGWPKDNLTLRTLKQGIEKGTYKWTYANNNYTQEDVYEMLMNGQVELS